MESKIKQEIENKVKQDYQEEMENRHEKDVESLLNYACKNGFISEDCENWSAKEKEDYYWKCQSYEPEQDN